MQTLHRTRGRGGGTGRGLLFISFPSVVVVVEEGICSLS